MKAYSFNGEHYGYYGYDASGERTYKYGLDRVETTTNQGGIDITEINWEVNQLMLYPNGYININQNGEYTKHYYADALRIASKIGSGKSGLDLCSEASIIENIYPSYLSYRIDLQREEMKEELTELVPNSEDIVDIVPNNYPDFCDIGPGGQEPDLFFYHPDHLGSTGMVTDNSSNITQGMLYAPFGEIICDYNPTFHDSPMPNYAFNAKELDEENNMYYYSARYYAPPTFISRDPMFEKYPSISPYTYCANNPMKFVDPTGKNFGDFVDESGCIIGNDGIKDGKVYVIKTTQSSFNNGSDAIPGAGLSEEEAKATKDFIKTNSGNTESFKSNDIAYKNSVEIVGSSEARQQMVDIVTQDNGTGGTGDNQNREYGGSYDNTGVYQAVPGPVQDPASSVSVGISIPTYEGETISTFHSHSSGKNGNSFWSQPPSLSDINNAGNRTNYIFGRGDGKVYIYNSSGVQAVLPHDAFVNFKK
jgi:RHS repeat-associated protein